MKSYVGSLPRWEDERAIRHTMDLYSHAMDYGEEEVWRDCFTDDALFLVSDAQKSYDEATQITIVFERIGAPGGRATP